MAPHVSFLFITATCLILLNWCLVTFPKILLRRFWQNFIILGWGVHVLQRFCGRSVNFSHLYNVKLVKTILFINFFWMNQMSSFLNTCIICTNWTYLKFLKKIYLYDVIWRHKTNYCIQALYRSCLNFDDVIRELVTSNIIFFSTIKCLSDIDAYVCTIISILREP